MSAETAVDYEPVIGLEIHVQLATKTKMFCGCELSFGEPPNTRTCPVCLGLPGTLPTINARAIEFALQIGAAVGSELAPRSIFHRKNYFYPDLPKGYQISQYDEPLCRGGRLGEVRIHRVHLEEDAAKLIHVGASGRIHGSEHSVVDFNRGGTPLVEIVTEPDLHSPEEAREWLALLRATLRALGVSDVNMEEGSLRCDANVSLRPAGSDELGQKTELKNMNSFRFLERGVHAEIARQRELLAGGKQVVAETLHFDPASGELTPLRSKEEAHDYRYFPEPDLLPVEVTEAMVKAAHAALPELPAERAARFERELGLAADTAWLLALRGELGDYFERASAASEHPQQVANWVTGELRAHLGDADPAQSRVEPEALAALIELLVAGTVTQTAAKEVLGVMVAQGGEPGAIVADRGLQSIGDDNELAALVAAAIAANPDVAEKIRAGDERAIGAIIGHVMRETKGRADGAAVTKLVQKALAVPE